MVKTKQLEKMIGTYRTVMRNGEVEKGMFVREFLFAPGIPSEIRYVVKTDGISIRINPYRTRLKNGGFILKD